jgi:hypothetical protein
MVDCILISTWVPIRQAQKTIQSIIFLVYREWENLEQTRREELPNDKKNFQRIGGKGCYALNESTSV